MEQKKTNPLKRKMGGAFLKRIALLAPKKEKEVVGKKAKEFDSQAVARFFSSFLMHKKAIALSFCVLPFSILSSLGAPWLLIQIVDNHILAKNLENLFPLVGLYISLFVIGFVADITYSYSLQKAGSDVLTTIRAQLFAHCLKLPKSYFDRTPNGVTLTRITSDFETIGETLAVGVISLFVDLLKTIILCLFLLWVSWRLSLILAIGLPILLWIAQELRKRLRKNYDLARVALADSVAYLNECLQGVRTILLGNAVPYSFQKYAKKNERFLSAQKISNVYEALLFSSFEGASIILIAFILWYGNGQTQKYEITLGTLIVFYQVMQKIFIPVREFAQQFSTIQRAVSSMAGVERLFQQNPDPKIDILPIEEKKPVFHALQAKNLAFRYNANQDWVLKNINLHLKNKERIALVGRTGSGKSTLMKLLTKQYSHYEGSFTLNGKEIRDMTKNEALAYFSTMNQDTFLFQETIKANINLHKPEVDEEKITTAIQYVQLEPLIKSLPEGLNFQVSEGGKNLSAGQCQMLGLARAVAFDKPVFLFDEATATIDSITEELIQRALDKIFHEKTVLAIAHRLSTIRNSDRIYCLQNGEMIESGSHDQLLAKGGYYADLIASAKI